MSLNQCPKCGNMWVPLDPDDDVRDLQWCNEPKQVICAACIKADYTSEGYFPGLRAMALDATTQTGGLSPVGNHGECKQCHKVGPLMLHGNLCVSCAIYQARETMRSMLKGVSFRVAPVGYKNLMPPFNGGQSTCE